MYRRITITLLKPEFEALCTMAEAHTRPVKHQIAHLIRQALIREGWLADSNHASQQDHRKVMDEKDPL